MNCVLSVYPLSHTFKARIEESFGTETQYLLLSDLRKRPLKEIFFTLINCKCDRLMITLEENTNEALLVLLKLLAILIRCKKIYILNFDLSTTPYRKYEIVRIIFHLMIASASLYYSYWHCCLNVLFLLKKKSRQFISKSEKNILYLNANLWFGVKAGGSLGHIAGVANAFSKQGFTVSYAALNSITALTPKIRFLQIKSPRFLSIPAELNYYRFNNQIVKEILINNLSPQFIYQRMSLANYSGLCISQKLQIPLILEYNGSELWVSENWGHKLRYNKLAKQCEEVCLKHANLIVTVSEVLRDELIQRGVERNKIIFYPNCIDPDIFHPCRFNEADRIALRKRYKIPQNSIVLTFVGTFGEWHGVDVLALAIRKFIETYPEYLENYSLRFLFVGDGVKMPKIRNILSEKSHEKYIIYAGLIPQEQAPEYLYASDILISPHIPNPDGSRFFGSPTKLFEYMAMSKAIIASNLEQIGQVLHKHLSVETLPLFPPNQNSHELGILCEPGNIEHIVAAILFLIKSPAWRTQLGENAQKEVLAKYTWQHHVNKILEKI